MQVSKVRSNLNQIGYDINIIHEMVSGLEGKIELLESKQDKTNSGLYYLCQVAENIKGGSNDKKIKDVDTKLLEQSRVLRIEDRTKGLQFIVGNDESNKMQKTPVKMDDQKLADVPAKNVSNPKMRIHRSYPVGLSFAADVYGLAS
ncbi:uncharacterized protein LOC111378220 [Olea europaea var. sylvestris]|uniref:uncharacterized protein LOC111378220 n=1 Tax=Olea europaea var. sylvestris TaxID=158386 RepID=UPI000C1CE5D0|nr:uncharacterized protein LOC111378220 [Olea europaea var. sylvestris]